MLKPIPFMKIVGAGNDFIVVDNRKGNCGQLSALAVRVCDRHRGVGADGLLAVQMSDRADFRMKYFNCDGSEASMCGNGARCIARFAHLKGICGRRTLFETNAGLQHAVVSAQDVMLRMPVISKCRLSLKIRLKTGTHLVHWIDTGVPHAIQFVKHVALVPVDKWGRGVREHRTFNPAGTNVDFVQLNNIHKIKVRTYERGVEGETLACGTGAVASACVAALLGKVKSPVTVLTRSGQSLSIAFKLRDGSFQEVTLTGEARSICSGTLYL